MGWTHLPAAESGRVGLGPTWVTGRWVIGDVSSCFQQDLVGVRPSQPLSLFCERRESTLMFARVSLVV